MIIKTSAFLAALLSAILLFSATCLQAQQLAPGQILLNLKKLNTYGTVLYVAAHPDDENTRLIAWLANEKCLRTGYLSITRGDGGQNLIGKEQGPLLGLIRTQELLAARQADGGEQMFTRAIDFGYSKTPEETFAIWNRDSILKDVVYAIRKFRPDAIICRFGTDGSGGHGHHTASAMLAEAAYDIAGDSTKYPELNAYVKAWQPKLLAWNFWQERATVSGQSTRMDVGGYNQLLGKSYGEIAAESRSMHKSQGFGVVKGRGQTYEYFKVLRGTADTADLFSTINIGATRCAGMQKLEATIGSIIKAFNPSRPDASITLLLKAKVLIEKLPDPYYRSQKTKQVDALILACAGSFAEANATDYIQVPGDTMKVSLQAINRSATAIKIIDVTIASAKSVQAEDTVINLTLKNNVAFKGLTSVVIPASAPYTNPYWLANTPHTKGLSNVPDQAMVGKPESPAAFSATFNLRVAGQPMQVTVPIRYRWVEPADGEKYRALEVLPPVTVNLDREVYMMVAQPWREKVTLKTTFHDIHYNGKYDSLRHGPIYSIKQTIRYNRRLRGTGSSFYISDYYNFVSKYIFDTAGFHPNYSKNYEFSVIERVWPLPGVARSGRARAFGRWDDSSGFDTLSVRRVAYPHIPIQTILKDNQAKLVTVEINLGKRNIGYLPGAGDDVAECLKQIGYNITILDDAIISSGNLAKFDAIVIGVRAYNVNERMAGYRSKLLSYIENGGTVIAQYNTNNWVSSLVTQIGPYPFGIGRDRVTNENSPIAFLLPDHELLNKPNKITQADFEGWVQERGIYFAADLAKEYEMPLAMSDANEPPKASNTIFARYGKGRFIYTGLAFFRQLPAGVPGAYRLFANMIGEAKP